MNLREERGKQIASAGNITQSGKELVYIVPSQSGSKSYKVDLTGEDPTCTCPDFEERGKACKHVYAVAFTVTQTRNDDGSTTTTETLTLTETRETYPQKWTAYNKAQTTEQDKFQVLLADLCAGVEEPDTKFGRPRLPLKDMIFSATFKIYSTFSGRRFMSELRAAHERGYIWKTPHYNSVFRYLESDSLTPILRDLVQQSSLPLKAVETDFAVDSSGFITSRFFRWYDHKYGRIREKHSWVKAHLICGVKTNVVTAIEIADKEANDCPFMAPLVEKTAQNFKIREVSGDKAYGSIKNFDAVINAGGTPYVPFRTDHSGRKGGMWQKLFHFFMYKRETFLEHYHKRSNVETTFSMMKRKFGDSLRSRTDTAMVNEALCKALCHNLVVLIHEMHELGIEPKFWSALPQ